MKKIFYSIALVSFIGITYANEIKLETSNNPAANQLTPITNNRPVVNKVKSEEKNRAKISWSFVQTANEGILYKVSGSEYKLLLNGVSPYITSFGLRPNRMAKLLDTMSFISTWNFGQNNFGNNPPNALIVASAINEVLNKNQTFYLATLSSPKYDADNNRVSYVVKFLEEKNTIIKQLKLQNVTIMIN